jgi:hypothetical protein
MARFELIARCGYAARGIVFLLVAGLAMISSFAAGGPDTKSALDSVLSEPLGRVWLGLIGLGLLGFVVWRIAQALGNADQHDRSPKSYLIRACLLVGAITYLGLSLYAFEHAWSQQSGGGGGGEKSLAAWMMGQPFGSYLAAGVGAGFIVGGTVTAYKGVSRNFEKYLKLPNNRLVLMTCIYGLVSRGVIFGIVGVFFVYAAITVDPTQAGSMADALRWIRSLPFGGPLYFVAALGLAAFGIYNFAEAKFRVVRPPQKTDLETEMRRFLGTNG